MNINKSFRFTEPELFWLKDLKELYGYSETDIIRFSLCFFYSNLVPVDNVSFFHIRDKYYETADLFNYRSLQKKVLNNAVQP